MRKSEIETIRSLIRLAIGVHVRGSLDRSGARTGLSFWFENYNRSDGPVFSVRPSGLKRHTLSLAFGAYSKPCVDHIKENASQEAYSLAYAFIDLLQKEFDVKINRTSPTPDWRIDEGFSLTVVRKISNQNDSEPVLNTVRLVMVPLMAAIAELIGYEDLDEPYPIGSLEGELTQALVKKRERSSRNRLLCLSIHGEFCGICGCRPTKKYGDEVGSILEVHHIEPLSMTKEPKVYDPATDLIPLCPNCHRAVHRRNPPYMPNELKELLLI